ncbi:Nucleotide/sugar transporter family protein [Rhynchospora pubera]|uniref:Nucleotide/sugar transporter family protein n=1 Tax=Rhynchospora pubera TaxID=906938 RepID=A0AAV8C2P6_9POAL|nr:Nucleotide/sugar transporter family protein [Rhynchospora pubera]
MEPSNSDPSIEGRFKEQEEETSKQGPKQPHLRKEPSFSRWCKDDADPSKSTEISLADADSEEFDLPFLNENSSERREMSGNGAGGRVYSSFDVENGIGLHGDLQKSDGRSISPLFVLKVLMYTLIWYTFSTCLTLYNKEMLGKKYFHFPAPLLMNTIHFTMQAVLSRVIIFYRSRKSVNKHEKMSWKDYSIRVVPLGLATALDINLSNISLVFITVTFATMCKSGGPIFLLLFAFAFRLEKPSFKLLGIMLVISVGVLLSVAKATEFNLWGFILIMLAAALSGFRWSMTQILLQKEAYGLKDPINLMSSVTPVMAIVTAILSLTMDPWSEFSKNNFFNNPRHIMRSCLLMLFGGAMAFLMVLTEYVLVSDTSAVTVTVIGIFKDAITILVAVLFFNDPFTWLKGIGLLTITLGVGLFNLYKYQKIKKGDENREEMSLSSSNGAAKYTILDDPENEDDSD